MISEVFDLEGIPYTIFRDDYDNTDIVRHEMEEIFFWKMYESVNNKIRPGDIVIDGGANLGMFTLFALNRGAKLVIAVEPMDLTFAALVATVNANYLTDKVMCINKALWHTVGCELLFAAYLHSAGRSKVVTSRQHNRRVQSDTIDNIAATLNVSINHIKLDVEGSDQQALQGAVNTLEKDRPGLSLCLYHKPEDMTEIPAFVSQFGYGKPELRNFYKFVAGTWERGSDGRKQN